MTRPEDHLLRAAGIAAGDGRLSELTGLARIGMAIRTLETGESMLLDAAGEQFLYVLDGRGSVQAVDDPLTIEAGDFLGLTAGETVTVRAEGTLTVLTGGLSSP